MNCDQVFQHLASAESVAANGELERHLNGCRACRQMAGLFLPAVQLFATDAHDDAGPAANGGKRWPQVWDSVALAEQTAAQLRQHARLTDKQQRWTPGVLRLAGVLSLGIALGVLCARAYWSGGSVSAGTLHAVGEPHRSFHPSECNFDKLIDRQLSGEKVRFCSSCEPKVEAELASVVALCMVCHIKPGEAIHANASQELGFE
jgi:hypothetical protein